MRRQARFTVGGTLVARTASALQVWLWLLLFVFQNEFRISGSIQPGYLDFDNLPDTNFTCTGKVIGGYYADLETSCQMFHVCTVGQHEEPMDIKFLCLNGTVFDQETRVCERVDEVDCTKSEKFYSLNLELYGSTAPPIIQPEIPETKLQPKPTESSNTQTSNKPTTTDLSDPFTNDLSTIPDKTQNQSSETIDSTEDPIQEIKQDDNKNSASYSNLQSKQEENKKDYEEDDDSIDDDDVEYEEDIAPPLSSTTAEGITSTSTTTRKPSTSQLPPLSTVSPSSPPTPIPHFITSSTPSISSYSPQIPSIKPSIIPSSTLDPSLLSPQEFIYRHRGPGSEAISFQRQSFRPADGIYITHAPPQQFDHFQYESSRTAPRPSRPVPFVQRPQPTPFRPTTADPRDQILRPGQSSQSSERLETTVKHRHQNYPQHLPPQQPLPFNPFYYDRKRSEDSSQENESSLSARSVPPLTVTERNLPKPKSPPRVIVTASASVSDSNGKRLNYTVGNVVNAVKPIVAINYDDYKESDLIFDPFFLDVPKLQSRRKTRSSNIRKIVNVPMTATMSAKNIKEKVLPTIHKAKPIKMTSTSTTTTTTAAWNPEDYVDDNYEPHSYYIPPPPPLAVLVTDIKIMKQDRLLNDVIGIKSNYNKVDISKEQAKPTSSIAHEISSQSVGTEATLPVTSPIPIEAPACITSRSSDCRIRA
ncbi:mucin-2-like [Danaus plexippus]|uniref:mucin-2-like n=1 Tax=Danaus plexippus TaxID=13037 RepID=UPI002AB0A536|nr:mucin-2-like [Danaus plexippus]XP_061377858.1 mucin-2-like [Danaus plexippus]